MEQLLYADDLYTNVFVTHEWRVQPASYPMHLSFAKVIAITDKHITVLSPSGADPVFADDGLVKVQRTCVDSFEQMWLQPRNYQPHADGSQTWDIIDSLGTVSGSDGAFAFYYGKSDNTYYEVTVGDSEQVQEIQERENDNGKS